jgi:very-short-patch-repair endonuclease/muconolactone delta-isomerase
MMTLSDLHIGPSHPCEQVIGKMSATIHLNPYEREALYGYPFVIGRVNDKAVRAPLFTVPISIRPERRGFVLAPEEEILEFNPMPFLGDEVSDARDLAVARLHAATPRLPLTRESLHEFMEVLQRELPQVTLSGPIDGRLVEPPSGPGGSGLRVIDCAGVLVAPQASYFLASDLDSISKGAEVTPANTLVPLLAGSGPESQVDITREREAAGQVYFPFPSNRAQRRAAILLDDPSTRVLRIDGPPGTGKSLTVANLVCHIVATGRSVLVTSTKDKALSVVDDKLRELQSPLLPMTLLHRNKQPMLDRLALITKSRSKSELDHVVSAVQNEYARAQREYQETASSFGRAIVAEEKRLLADRQAEAASGFGKLAASLRRRSAWGMAKRVSPRDTAEMSGLAREARSKVFRLAQDYLRVSAEHRTASETRQHKQNREELSKTVRRNQSSYKNYSLFDRLKQDLDRAKMLLQSLPAWVMSPDDVARLFPCTEGLFDVVIIDEASQVDLPSILPILHRGKKLVICGDLQQMQPQRFAFVAATVARGVWTKHRVSEHDPDGQLYPTSQSLLDLAGSRSEESVFLDEHFRCLPSIIAPSNARFYQGRLRIMTDESRKKFGPPATAAFTLHHVVEGQVVESSDSQVNEPEARALMDFLKIILVSPDYAGATIGVIALYEQQMRYLQDLVTDEVGDDLGTKHDLVVVNPDGFQGDERDVILYSLSYDASGMTQHQLSARMVDRAHEMGMLNVMWTRPRHEVHIFHSAPITAFTYAGDRPSPLSEWLRHAAEVEARGRVFRGVSRVGKVDSEFEAEVTEALVAKGYVVQNQYPACGFWIDLVVRRHDSVGVRLAVECDGETWHSDEHGELKLEDLEREEILERAGWEILRIPYSGWRRARADQLRRIDDWFSRPQPPPPRPGEPSNPPSSRFELLQQRPGGPKASENSTPPQSPLGVNVQQGMPMRVELPLRGKSAVVNDRFEWSVISACCQNGRPNAEDVLRRAAAIQGARRLGSRIRENTSAAASRLQRRGLLAIEDGEWFLTAAGRQAKFVPVASSPRAPYSRRKSPARRRTRRRRSS